MPYKVVALDKTGRVGHQLQQLLNEQENDGWIFAGLETLETVTSMPDGRGSRTLNEVRRVSPPVIIRSVHPDPGFE